MWITRGNDRRLRGVQSTGKRPPEPAETGRGSVAERTGLDVTDATDVPVEDRAIGERVRTIRQRRGMSVEAVAGLAKIDKSFLSRLETGKRAFTRRGLLGDLAIALSCSVADLTGQPYLLRDRQSVEVDSTVARISRALHDATLDDVPDQPTRPLVELITQASRAHYHADEASYGPAGQGLDDLLTELHIHGVTGSSETRQAALAALVEACKVAYILAKRTGRIELAGAAAQRGVDAARLAERPDLIGFMEMNLTSALLGLGAQRRGRVVCSRALDQVSALPGPTPGNTAAAEARGMLHLTTALLAVREGRASDADTHLAEARSLAAHTGDQNAMRYHFGPTNVAAWELGLAVETCTGPGVARRLARAPINLSVFASKGRSAYVHFDLARAWAQEDGTYDQQALYALDTADRLAPVRIRNDPIARDVVMAVDRRAKRPPSWVLTSLKNRLGIA